LEQIMVPRYFRSPLKSVLALILLIVMAGSVSVTRADTVSKFSYTLDGSESTAPSRPEATQAPCQGNEANSFYYKVVQFTVTDSGQYAFEDDREYSSVDDGYLIILDGAYNPGSPLTNCIATFDDNAGAGTSIFLNAGQSYTMVQTTFSALATGKFRYRVHGPGVTSLGPAIGGDDDDAWGPLL
jgi:hypothetical protein